MNLSLAPQTQKLLEERMRSGGYATAEEAIRAGLESLRREEEWGDFEPGEWDRLIAEAEQSVAEHGTIPAEEVYTELRQLSEARRNGSK